MQGHRATGTSISELGDLNHESPSGNIQDPIEPRGPETLPVPPFMNPIIHEPQNFLDGQRYGQSSNPFSSNNVNLDPRPGQGSSSRSAPGNLKITSSGLQWIQPSSSSSSTPYTVSSLGGAHFGEASSSHPGNPMEGQVLPCKRKMGQSSIAGSSSNAQNAESSSWNHANLGIQEQVEPRHVLSRSVERFRRNIFQRINPSGRNGSTAPGPYPTSAPIAHSILPTSGFLAANSTNSPANAPALPTPALPTPALPTPALPTPALPTPALPTPALPTPALPTPALPTPALPTPALPTPAMPILAIHVASLPTPAIHAPALPTPAIHAPAMPTPAIHALAPPFPRSGFSVRWNGEPITTQPDSSLSAVVSQEGSSSNVRNILEHPMFVSANDTSSTTFVQSPAAVGSVGAQTVRVPENIGSGSQTGSHQASSQNNRWLQYHRRYPQYVRRSLSAVGSDAAAACTNNPVLPSASQGAAPPSRSGGGGHGRHWPPRPYVMERQGGDNVIGVPDSAQSYAEGRRRFLSEMRNVLVMMRRREALRNEPMFLGARSEAHDQHRDMRLDVDNMSYEQLLALGERIGNVSTGTSEETISTLLKQRKCVIAASGTLSETTEPCCICQEEYNDGEDVGTLDCGHDFHRDCIKQWLMQKNICPICKTTGLKNTNT